MTWACGNRSPSMLMTGFDPPRPANIAGLPKYVADARWIDSSSFGSVAGAFQPLPASPYVFIVTRAPYGGSASTISLSRRTARPASHVGGRRSEILSVVCGRSTLPPSIGSGSPAAPVIASAGRHVLFKISSYGPHGHPARREREAIIDLGAEHLRDLARLGGPLARDLDVKIARVDMPRPRILDAIEQLTQDAEARGHDPAGGAGVHAFWELLACVAAGYDAVVGGRT